VATRCKILRLKCTKFDFGWGSASDPAEGAYSTPQTTSCDALLLRGREGRREEGKGRGGERKGWEREGMPSPASSILL